MSAQGMRVIGVDPGLGITGFGIIEQQGQQLQSICYGTVRPPTKFSLPLRLKYLFDEIMQLCQEYRPDILSIEDTFYQKNVKAALSLGQARGTVLLAGAIYGIPCKEYSPRKVKNSVTGNGAATKEQVQFMVQRILNLPEKPTPLDASDALAIALCYLNQPEW
ncbi:MAG: crossover junction endodeoxyribonuclease RuvC [Candidatus Neomarinimicrobiota bacterium]|nr:MAG: crossover junction endodeoxyribonuclease RuvC [Candidatus Neomarinimicrobiota bacterium]